MANRPGEVRDAILTVLRAEKKPLTSKELREAVNAALGREVPSSSVRSYLNNNTPGMFTRTGRGTYKLAGK